ncbi:MAG: ATP-binding protein [Elusimicrobiota bacterium]|nr:MAG: ATP-binding protein [Elusimicrobiota bacterium]
MNPKGRVLLVGADPVLVNEMAPSMIGREFELVTSQDAKAAGVRLATESFSAVVLDAARVPPADREAMAKLQKERGGFALFMLEPPANLSPMQPLPLRRLMWPLPPGFLDQVRAVEVPVVFLAEQTLYITQGIQNELRRAGVAFIQMESPVGAVEMLAEQARLADEQKREREASKPKAAGFWEKLAGKEEERLPEQAMLGKVAVIRFSQTWADAVALDAKLRQTIPTAVAYAVTTLDPVRSAVAAVKGGAPAVLPREAATRVAEILTDGLSAARTGAREKERVLIVDNDIPTVSRLSEALLSLGYEVETTNDGDEAQKLIQKKPFHLAALGGSAIETASAAKATGVRLALKMREVDKNLCIILMMDQFPVQEALKGVTRAVELGLDDALLKPIEASRMVLSIQRALEKRFLRLDNDRLRKEAEESAKKLAEVNGFQTKFFATVAHDVKNPLTAILGYSEVLGMRLKDKPDELKCASHIHNAAKTLNLLVSDLVDLAAIESGKLRVEIGAMDLASVISEVKSRVDVVAGRKQIQFSSALPAVVPPLQGDPNRIGQVIQNLSTNAIQYTKEGGKVTIEVQVQPEWVIVGVRDTGIGISKEDLPRVWERFFQTKEAQTMRKAGFGLGLKISREIVQMHGGDMGIESELGVGSFFYFKLPVPKAAAAPAAPAAPAPTMIRQIQPPPATQPPAPSAPPAPPAAPPPPAAPGT